MCSRAHLPDEITICASPRLSALDSAVAAAYSAIKSAHGLAAADAIGIPYWRRRQACGSDARCIEQRQLEELAAFQAAGANVPPLASFYGGGSGPSFDCSKASRRDEIAICGSERLSDLDQRIAKAYAQILQDRGREAADAIGIPFWYRRGACLDDAGCIAQVMIEEIGQFRTAGVDVELPEWAEAPLPTPSATPVAILTPEPQPTSAPSTSGAGSCAGSKRVALVIGEADYPAPSTLRNPAHDAEDVADLLRQKLCFSVILATDASFDALSVKIGDFAAAAEGADVAIFYFSGHGMQYRQANYLLPVDAKLSNEYDLVHRSLSAQDIVALLESRARVSMVFLDACRTDPLEEEFRRRMAGAHRDVDASRGLAPSLETHGETIVVYATRPNATALDGSGRNSPFTQAFLEVFATPARDVELVLRDLAARVSDLTRGAQVPQRLTELRHGLMLLSSN